MKEISASIPQHLLLEPKDNVPKAKNVMGKDDFMKLLMTQLQNQDPLKPVDHQEFVAQLAQFGSLEQLTNIQKGIEGLHSGIGDEAKLSALGMIGKKVQGMGSEVELMEGQELTLRYSAKEGMTPVKAQIYSYEGKLVREMELGGKTDPDGIRWDGKDSEGKALPTGKYSFRVQAVDGSGVAQELATELSGKVTGVEMDGKNPLLIVQTPSGTTKVELAKIKNVSLDDSSKESNTVPKSKSSSAPLNANTASSLPKIVSKESDEESESSTVNDTPADGAILSESDLDRMWRGFPDLTASGR